jgi:S-(hydroxymethyl)glutathione dehydrogenase / alcohol dehydrogenase
MLGVIVQDGELILADDLEVRPPGPGEVSVRVLASGLCRSDLILLDHPDPDPMVMGHEAAGVVRAVGSEVAGIDVGQLVAVSCQRPCLRCPVCARGRYSACPTAFGETERPFTWRGRTIRSTARVSSLATEITVDAIQVHPVTGLAPEAAALIGCAVSTGYGTVRNVAGLLPGESVAVIGVGGIGVNSIQAARLLGAARVIAIDVNPDKEEIARRFGADEFVLVPTGVPADLLAKELAARIGRPVDALVDCTGQHGILAAAPALLSRGGRLALVGIPHDGAPASYDVMGTMHSHLTIAGALNGACDPFTDLPVIVGLAEQGRLDLIGQVSHRWPLTEVRDAIDALRRGDVLRVVIEMPAAD